MSAAEARAAVPVVSAAAAAVVARAGVVREAGARVVAADVRGTAVRAVGGGTTATVAMSVVMTGAGSVAMTVATTATTATTAASAATGVAPG